MKKNHFLFLFFFSCFGFLHPQSTQQKIDSLMQVAENSKDSIRLRIYNRVGSHYIFNDAPKAKSLLLKGIRDAKSKKEYFALNELVNSLGIYYDVVGKPDSSEFYFKKALELSKRHDHKVIAVMATNNLGMFHWNQGDYQEALGYFFKALEMNRTNTSRRSDGTYLNNIGLIYQEMGMYGKALEYHRKSLAIRKQYGEKDAIAHSMNNIGICLKNKGKYEEARKAFQNAIALGKESNEMGVYYSAMNNLGNLYILQEKTRKAIPLFEQTLKGRNDLNLNRNANLGTITSLVHAYRRSGNMEKALEYVKMGAAHLKEFPGLTTEGIAFYEEAGKTYLLSNKPKKGDVYFDKAIRTRDSIFSSENAENMAALEAKFETEKKERKILEQKNKLIEKDLQVRRKNTLIYGSLGLALLLGLIGYLLFNQQKLKNRQLKKEGELQTALAKIETQNQLQEQRLRISRDLHDNIGSQLTFIISSIDNLKYGFKEMPGKLSGKLAGISGFTTQTIYELRDTIWAMNKTDIGFEDLQSRITNFINKAKSSSGETKFEFNVAPNVNPEHSFTSVQGMNIYRIIQEAVNNALKHAEASTISVEIRKNPSPLGKMPEGQLGPSQFKITITDNGKGFNPKTAEMGNGLNNIKKRARDLGGEIEVVSEEDEGTKVVLDAPL